MTFTLRPINTDTDAALLHGWFTQDRARYWGMLESSVADVERMLEAIAAAPHHDAYLGCRGGVPEFLIESYAPALHPVGAHFMVAPGDAGMHLLVAPSDTPVHGFSRSVMTFVLDFLFADPAVTRIVVEPDARNEKILALNAALGFEEIDDIELTDKTARLSFCSRTAFETSRLTAAPEPLTPDHLTPEHWATATRILLRKAIGEFAHERLLEPTLAETQYEHQSTLASARYVLRSDDGSTEYWFAATRRALDHWSIPADSIRRTRGGDDRELDLLEFILEFRISLGITAEVLPLYLEEMSSTLAARAYTLRQSAPSSRQLVEAARIDDAAAWGQRVERSMTEGHPCFVATNGRLGFGLDDYRAFAPETGAGVHLLWLAVARSRAVFSSSRTLNYDDHLMSELGEPALARFAARLRGRGLDPVDYRFMPVHPWQWENKLCITFAAEIAGERIVVLGVGSDAYQAQQSIRTFFNVDVPERCYVKTALSVLNMGFMRGLSPQYMRATPAINDWLYDLVCDDAQLQAVGLGVLREVAAVGYHNAYYETASPAGSPYQKMLSALWRESPLESLQPGERVATMASLLHRDAAGRPFVGALIDESGLEPGEWLRRYLRAYLVPLVHCLFAYELAFMPHGENVILVLRNGAPVRILMKDIAEEIVVMGERTPLPTDVSRIRVAVPEDDQVLVIFTDVFDSFFRFLANILADDQRLPEQEFWRIVSDTVAGYQAATPEHAAAFARHDLFAAEFPRSCLNRLQLRNNRHMLDLADPSASLQVRGTLQNPLTRHRDGR